METPDAAVANLDDPVVGLKLAVRKGRLEGPTPQRAMEPLEGLRRWCLDLPPRDLRHSTSMPRSDISATDPSPTDPTVTQPHASDDDPLEIRYERSTDEPPHPGHLR